jgi:drug/metabolite transporter (DMT)-like permease
MTSSSALLAPWAWIPIVLWAALAQTARNAAQRSLVAQAGTLGATLARFLYGLPFAAAWVLVLHTLPATAAAIPRFGAGYFGWLLLGAMGQLAATAFLLAAMKQRNFVVGVAYSKTDALQVALFATLFLHELPGWITITAIALATSGVVMLSLPQRAGAPQANGGASAWTGGAALYGLASGAGFALSAVGYRGAALQLPGVSPWLIGAWGVLWAQAAQTLLLGGWLALRSPASLRAIATAWRVSTIAGMAGALASIGWFTAFALTSAANVRTLGMVEVIFSYLVSHRLMSEKLTGAERGGLALVLVGLVALCLQL